MKYLTTAEKWDVKNLHKWQGVEPVSAPIGSVFRAMKTLREVDDVHTPKNFAKEWSPRTQESNDAGTSGGSDGLGAIAVVVDISHDTPVYDPQGLESGGIAYRKFPTVSKLPPTLDEVRQFNDLIDELQAGVTTAVNADSRLPHPLIAVHCHYGFNRTGFFMVCYLFERLGWRLKDALAEFADKRPPGIRHAHFLDELWSRYWNSERLQKKTG